MMCWTALCDISAVRLAALVDILDIPGTPEILEQREDAMMRLLSESEVRYDEVEGEGPRAKVESQRAASGRVRVACNVRVM